VDIELFVVPALPSSGSLELQWKVGIGDWPREGTYVDGLETGTNVGIQLDSRHFLSSSNGTYTFFLRLIDGEECIGTSTRKNTLSLFLCG
jgi:hypothetical protein